MRCDPSFFSLRNMGEIKSSVSLSVLKITPLLKSFLISLSMIVDSVSENSRMAGGPCWTGRYLKSMVVPVIISRISLSDVIVSHSGRKPVRLPALKYLTLCSKPVIISGNRVVNLLTS